MSDHPQTTDNNFDKFVDLFTDTADIVGSARTIIGPGKQKFNDQKQTGTELTQTEIQSTVNTGRTLTGGTTEQLQIDDIAVQKIIQDVLGGADGLASIFAGEQNAGVFNSSVSAQAAGDLATRLAGEIAKLTAKRVTTKDEEELQQKRTRQRESSIATTTAQVLDPLDPSKGLFDKDAPTTRVAPEDAANDAEARATAHRLGIGREAPIVRPGQLSPQFSVALHGGPNELAGMGAFQSGGSFGDFGGVFTGGLGNADK